MIKNLLPATVLLLLTVNSSFCQSTTISAGPVLTVGKLSYGMDTRAGTGFGVEFTQRLLPIGSLRVYVGRDNFTLSKDEMRKMNFTSLRTGYQLNLLSRRFSCWADAGFTNYQYSYRNGYTRFSLSAGGGFNFWFGRMALVQTQLFYTRTSGNLEGDIISKGHWFTLRAAAGIGITKKRTKQPNK